MSSLYQAKTGQPFHISVGAIVVNDEGKILVHKRIRSAAPEQFTDNFTDRDEVYVLMRESLENDETLEEAVRRGMREEFGAEGTVEKYLGSLVASVKTPNWDSEWEKTTLYFQTRISSVGEREHDDESFSVLEWHDPEFLIERMRGQGGEVRKDLDESKIIEAYVTNK